MTWWSAIFATIVIIFPLIYRTVRGAFGAFEAFDEALAYSGKTLGLSNTYIFWRIRLPYCRQGILAGTVLAFARARRIRRNEHDCGLHARKNGNDFHSRFGSSTCSRR